MVRDRRLEKPRRSDGLVTMSERAANRGALIGVSVLFVLVMFAMVPWLTRTLSPAHGYFAVFCFYWICFCLPAGWYFQRRERLRDTFSLAVGKDRWIPWAVALQVGVVAIASWILLPDQVPAIAIVLALVFGLVNGTLEEFFWRGSYLSRGRGDARFQMLGVGLFTLWHVPLALAHGVTYQGGSLALVGGALGLGLFWGFLAYRTNHIGWPIVSHALTNAIAFIGLIAANFV